MLAHSLLRSLFQYSNCEAPSNVLHSALLRRARCRQLDVEHAEQPGDAELWDTVSRAFTLLRSRYTAPAFWRAGRMLFQVDIASDHCHSNRTSSSLFDERAALISVLLAVTTCRVFAGCRGCSGDVTAAAGGKGLSASNRIASG